MTYKHEDYDWHDPRNVLVVNNSEYDTVAYGTPKAKPVEVNIKAPSWRGREEAPLPKPRHDAADEGGCLACDWNVLRDRIKRAAENG